VSTGTIRGVGDGRILLVLPLREGHRCSRMRRIFQDRRGVDIAGAFSFPTPPPMGVS
jgi:hypothetical protein